MKYKKKTKNVVVKKTSVKEYMSLSFPFKYCLHVEIIPPKLGARQVQNYYKLDMPK